MIGVLEKLFEIYWGQPLIGGGTETWFAFGSSPSPSSLFRPQGPGSANASSSGCDQCSIASPDNTRPATRQTMRCSRVRQDAFLLGAILIVAFRRLPPDRQRLRLPRAVDPGA